MSPDDFLNMTVRDWILWYRDNRHNDQYWHGTLCKKMPLDAWCYQELVFRRKPQSIVETGVYFGGSLSFFATILPHYCRLVGVDSDMSRCDRIEDDRVFLIEGNSVSPSVLQRVEDIVEYTETMVVLDSRHTSDHVFREMEAYGPLVTPGQYMVVEDTICDRIPEIGPGEGPLLAVDEFVRTHDEFERDDSCDLFGIGYNSGGWLRRGK
jgi:cephalosporin hydroxylase